MKYMLVSLTIAASVVLAGCTQLSQNQNRATPPLVQNQTTVSNNTNDNVSPPTTAQTKNTKELSDAKMGFAVDYPSTLTLTQTKTCLEGCSPESTGEVFTFSLENRETVNMIYHRNQAQGLQYYGYGSTAVADFVLGDRVRDVSRKNIPGGTRYDFIIKGLQNIGMGLSGDISTSDTAHVIFVRDDGRMYDWSVDVGPDQELLDQIVNTFRFI